MVPMSYDPPRAIGSLCVGISDSVYDSFVCRPHGKNILMRIQYKSCVHGGVSFSSLPIRFSIRASHLLIKSEP